MFADPWNTNTWAEDGGPCSRDVEKLKKKYNRRCALLERLKTGVSKGKAELKGKLTGSPKIKK
jgi:hypothetical protein